MACGSGWEEKLVLCLCSYMNCLSLQHCSKLSESGGGPWPEERENHAACCLNYGQPHPQLLVIGGYDRQTLPLGDAWILDVDSGRWRKVRRKCSCTVHSVMVTTVNSLLTNAPNSRLTRFSRHGSMYGLIFLYYCTKKLPTNGLSGFWTADTSD